MSQFLEIAPIFVLPAERGECFAAFCDTSIGRVRFLSPRPNWRTGREAEERGVPPVYKLIRDVNTKGDASEMETQFIAVPRLAEAAANATRCGIELQVVCATSRERPRPGTARTGGVFQGVPLF